MDAAGYWRERAERNERKAFAYSQREAQLVTRWFGRAEREMKSRITAFYRQYAEDEGISLQEARKTLTDRRALSVTLAQSARLAELYPEDRELAALLRKSYLGRAVSREEFLRMQLQLLASEVTGQYAAQTGQSLTQVFEAAYYQTLFDAQQFSGYGSSFNRLNTHQIEAAVQTAWSGKNYSARIWGAHRQTLARYLNRIVTTGVIQGRPLAEMTAQLRQAMACSAYDARRLIRTECGAAAAKGNLAAYRENGTEQFELVSTLDNRTSALCRGMDGKIFSVSEGRIGVNMPPLHPFCRSTTVPYLPDARFDWDDTRAARGKDGRTYRVPGEMTYREWHREYVEKRM